MSFKGSPVAIKIKNSIDDQYREYITDKIPILNILFDNIIDYCKELRDNHTLNKIDNINGILNTINEHLRKLEKNELKKLDNLKKYYNENSEDKVKIINNTIKIIKSHNLKAKGLIEIMIQLTLNCYDIHVNSNINMVTNNSFIQKRFLQKMNRAKGVSLQQFIINFYNDNRMSINDKNNYLLNILKKIANKLLFLQSEGSCIHGDFHSDNICIDEYDDHYNWEDTMTR